MQKAIKDGTLNLGFTEIACAVLADGTRLITTTGMNKALGRSNPSGGKGIIDNLPPFLNVNILKPFISNELLSSTVPMPFQTKKGVKAFGYKAETLPNICEVYLKARDAGVLSEKQMEHAAIADLIIRSLAKVGIVALIDEATGFQEFRDKEFLQNLLEKYLSKEAAKWAKTFNDSFYLSIFKLKKWNPSKEMRLKPHAMANITKDLVYKRIAPGLLDALEEKNPISESGYREFRHHQMLSRDQGLSHLKGHLFMLEKLMDSSHTWEEFMEKVNTLLPYPCLPDLIVEPICND